MPPRVLVVQNGSRHNYAVPVALHSAGMLEAFYTDACGNVGAGRLLGRCAFLPGLGKTLTRLRNRRVPPAIRHRTKTFALASLAGKVLPVTSPLAAWQMTLHGLGHANLIYSSLGWSLPFLAFARKNGTRIVTEFYLCPSIWKTYQAEYRAFPDWEDHLPMREYENGVGSPRDPCAVSDFIIAPSEGVRDDTVREHRFPREQILVVPYGVADTFFQVQNRPIPGRILFTGHCSLGKGIHYLAMAADMLAANPAAARLEFHAAGAASDRVRRQPLCRHLTFLGRISRDHLLREYAAADLFVLPSLSEGSAAVTYEALAAGLPVITTAAAGSLVKDGFEGLIVPERDPQALAKAILHLTTNRHLRTQMAVAARTRALDYTWSRYGERLADAMRTVSS